MTYSKAQLQALWISVGGSPSRADVASAVALAESGGNPNSTDNDANGSVDRGLWQINSVHGSQSTYNPVANARAAISISNNGNDWGAWVTYNSGAYKKFLSGKTSSNGNSTLSDVEKGVAVAVGGPLSLPVLAAGDILGGSTNPIKQVGAAIGDAVSWATELGKFLAFLTTASGWDRVLKVGGGGLLLLMALNELVKAGGVNPVTTIAKAVK